MTQPPTPYYTPYPYPPPPPDLGRPARYAGLMMIILGSLTLVLGICAGGMGQFLQTHLSQFPADFQAQLHKAETEMHASIQTIAIASAVIIAVPGVLLMVLSIFVRKGGFVSAVLGILFTGLILLYLVVNFLGSVALAAVHDPRQAIGPGCVGGVTIALFALQLYWLVKAAFNAGPLKAFNQYQQAWQWQSQQHYQQFQQPYGTPPPPPPPGMPPPPPASPS